MTTRREASTSPGRSPRVLISYSHDDETHEAFVKSFADRLRNDGIDSWIDQYVSGQMSWIQWMTKQIKTADFVIMVCTETYRRRCEDEEEPGRGQGVRAWSLMPNRST